MASIYDGAKIIKMYIMWKEKKTKTRREKKEHKKSLNQWHVEIEGLVRKKPN